MRKSDRKHKEFLQAVPRFILAILIALVISKPLEIKIFENEINTELTILGQEILKIQENSVRSRSDITLDSLSNEVKKLKSEVAVKQTKRNELFKIAQEEADGTGGTKKRNAGPIYRIKQKDAQRVQSELENLTTSNNQSIKTAQESIKAIQKNRDNLLHQLANPNLNGLSFKLTALDRLGKKHATIWFANLFIIFLFIAIEIAPILTKLISPIGPYDNLLEVREHYYKNYRKEKVTISDLELEKKLSSI